MPLSQGLRAAALWMGVSGVVDLRALGALFSRLYASAADKGVDGSAVGTVEGAPHSSMAMCYRDAVMPLVRRRTPADQGVVLAQTWFKVQR